MPTLANNVPKNTGNPRLSHIGSSMNELAVCTMRLRE
jgi:hypothetical protein